MDRQRVGRVDRGQRGRRRRDARAAITADARQIPAVAAANTSMSDGILLALAVLGPAAAAIRWIRRGANFGTACWIYCLFSIPIWLVMALWIKEPGHSVLYDMAYGFAGAIMGGAMGTLVCFVPGWLICSGTKGLFEEKALLRSAGKLLLGLFLYGFWTLVFFATKGQ